MSEQAQAGPTTLVITRADLDENNVYVGAADVTDWNGDIEIAADLGWVRFSARLSATRSIRSLSGSGIKAGEGIKAGWGIEAGEGIKAGWGIEAGEGIKAGWGIEAGEGIKAGEGIEAGEGIKAGEGIEAGLGIKAGEGIEAGLGIEAGSGIEAGWAIIAKWIASGLRIFAGTCNWRLPSAEEQQVRAELREGVIAFGKHVPPAPSVEA